MWGYYTNILSEFECFISISNYLQEYHKVKLVQIAKFIHFTLIFRTTFPLILEKEITSSPD